jgi:hypothetical protein
MALRVLAVVAVELLVELLVVLRLLLVAVAESAN